MMRALVVDDEEPARARLRQLLAGVKDVEIVGEANDGEQAMERILALRPDLVLLDIQMPGCSGLDVAASLPAPRPRVIFCTAHEEHAVDAFDVHAVDYLLKPVTRSRLWRALDRARTAATAADTADRAMVGPERHPVRFLARQGNRYVVVPGQEVLLFASEGGLTRLVTAGHRYWMEPTLDDLERRVDPARFCRVSRPAIVNLDCVRQVTRLPSGGGEATLTDGMVLAVSRRRLTTLMDRLGRM